MLVDSEFITIEAIQAILSPEPYESLVILQDVLDNTLR